MQAVHVARHVPALLLIQTALPGWHQARLRASVAVAGDGKPVVDRIAASQLWIAEVGQLTGKASRNGAIAFARNAVTVSAALRPTEQFRAACEAHFGARMSEIGRRSWRNSWQGAGAHDARLTCQSAAGREEQS